MTKKLIAFLLFGLAFLSIGCIEAEQEIYLNEDGSGRAIIQYRISEGIAEAIPAGPFGGATKPGSIRQHILSKPGLSIRDVKVWTQNDTRFIYIDMNFEEISQLNEDQYKYSWQLKEDHWEFKFILKSTPLPQHQNPLQDKIAVGLKQDAFTLKAHLPKKITEHNARKVERSTATWGIPLGEFLDPKQPRKRIFYANIEASTWERVKHWWDSVWQ